MIYFRTNQWIQKIFLIHRLDIPSCLLLPALCYVLIILEDTRVCLITCGNQKLPVDSKFNCLEAKIKKFRNQAVEQSLTQQARVGFSLIDNMHCESHDPDDLLMTRSQLSKATLTWHGLDILSNFLKERRCTKNKRMGFSYFVLKL